MAQNFIGDGCQVTVVLGSGQTGFKSGSPYKIGNQVGVILSLTRNGATVFTNAASAQGDIAVVQLEGVFTVPKEAPLVIAQGDLLYWDNTNSVFTKTSSGNTFAGYAYLAAISAATTVQVNLWSGDSVSFTQAASAPVITGTLTGTTTGAMADISPIALSTSNTYTDAAVNAAINAKITAVNLDLKELQTKINATITALKNASLMA
jgi:predicted RecA/RadA family phage recombinase